jgi:hypothetical protein
MTNFLGNKIYYNLKETFENNTNNYITIAIDNTNSKNKGSKKYCNISYSQLNTIIKKNYLLYETLKEERKPYFDIEYEECDKTKLINNNIKDLIKECFNDINITIEDKHFLEYGITKKSNSGKWRNKIKVSYHIVINNGYKFNNLKDLQKFKSYLFEKLNEKYTILIQNEDYVIDKIPYGKNQQFKLPYQSKANEDRILKPTNDDDFILKDYLISYDIEDYNIINTDTIELKIQNKKFKTANGKNFDAKKWDCDLISKYMDDVKNCDYIINRVIDINNIDDLVDSIYNSKNISYEIYFRVGSAIKRTMGSNGFNTLLRWVRKYKSNVNEEELKKDYEKFSNEFCGYKTLLTLAKICNKYIDNANPIDYLFKEQTPTITVNKKFLDIQDFKINDYNTIFIKSPMGSGKSYNLKQVVNDYEKIVYLSSRRAFAESMYQDFKDYGFKNYMNEDKISDKMIISVESISKFYFDNVDLLIIDESESIFNIISSDTLTDHNFNENLIILSEYIKNSKKVLVMDAYLSNRSFNAIKTIRNDNDYYYIKNEFKNEERLFYEIEEKEDFLREIIKDFKNNNRIVIVCGSKKFGFNIVDELERLDLNKRIRFYNAERPLDLNKCVNKEWEKIDCLIYTPTITCGISYTNKDFDKLFIYTINKGSSHFRDTIQAHKRVRYFKENEICICINDKYKGFNKTQYPTNPIDIKEMITTYRKDLFINNTYVSINDNPIFKDWVLDIHINNIMETNIHSIYLRKVVYKYFQLENIKLKKNNDNINNIKLNGFDDAWRYEDIKNISYDDVLIIKNNIRKGKTLKEEEYKKFIKFKFKNVLRDDDEDDEDDEDNEDDEEMYNYFKDFKKIIDDFKKAEIFNGWFKLKNKTYFKNMMDFNNVIKYGIDNYTKLFIKNENIEFYKLDILRKEHLYKILSDIKVIDIENQRINFNKVFTTQDLEELTEKYEKMNIVTINQLFKDKNMDDISKGKKTKGEKRIFTTKTMKSLLDKLLKDNFNYKTESVGTYKKQINNKRKKYTQYKIIPNGEKIKPLWDLIKDYKRPCKVKFCDEEDL